MESLLSVIHDIVIFGVLDLEPRHERAYRNGFSASLPEELKDPSGQLRSDPLTGKFRRHLRVNQDEPTVLDPVVGRSEQAVAQRHLEAMQLGIFRDDE